MAYDFNKLRNKYLGDNNIFNNSIPINKSRVKKSLFEKDLEKYEKKWKRESLSKKIQKSKITKTIDTRPYIVPTNTRPEHIPTIREVAKPIKNEGFLSYVGRQFKNLGSNSAYQAGQEIKSNLFNMLSRPKSVVGELLPKGNIIQSITNKTALPEKATRNISNVIGDFSEGITAGTYLQPVKERNVTKTIGEITSFLTPTSIPNLLFKGGENIAAKFLPKIALNTSKKIVPRLFKSTVKSGAGMTGITTGQEALDYLTGRQINKENIINSAKNIGLNTAFGAGFGVGGEIASPILKRLNPFKKELPKLKISNKKLTQPIKRNSEIVNYDNEIINISNRNKDLNNQKIIGNIENITRRKPEKVNFNNENLSTNPIKNNKKINILDNIETIKRDIKLVKASNKLDFKHKTLQGVKMNEDRIKFFKSEIEKEKNRLISEHVNNYLKTTMKKGTTQGGVYRDQLGNITGRYGAVSNNDLWYQKFRSINKRPPNKKELIEIAEKHLKDGFEHNGGIEKPNKSFTELNNVLKEIDNLPNMNKFNKQVNNLRIKNTLNNKSKINKVDNTLKNVKINENKPQKINTNINTLKEKNSLKIDNNKFKQREFKSIPYEILKDKNKFYEYYNLNKSIDNQKEVIDRITKDIGNRIINKVKSDKIEDIVKYYKNKYNLPEIIIKPTLKSENNYARIQQVKKGEPIVIKINPNKPIENQIGALRHELEHGKDMLDGFKIKNITSLKDTISNTYNVKGHHKYYDYFEPDYLRRSLLKELEKNKTQTKISENITKTENKINQVSNKGISKHEQTVKNSDKTNKKFKEYLENKKPTEYEKVSNKSQWEKAQSKISSNDKDEILNSIKNKKMPDSQDMHDLMALHKHYTEKGNLDKANEALTELTIRGSKLGQSVQAMAAWNNQTTEGVLKMAVKNKIKTIEMSTTYKQSEKVKNEINKLREVIKTLEKNPSKNKKEMEYNMKLLSGKEKSLKDIESKIEKAKLEPKVYNYIKDHFDNYKSQQFYDNVYKNELNKLTGGKIPTPQQIFKATEKAEREKLVEFNRAMQKVADQEGSTGREKLRALQRIMLLNSPRTIVRNNVSNALNSIIDVHFRENSIAPIIDYLSAVKITKSITRPILQPLSSGRTTIFSLKKTKAYMQGFKKGSKDFVKDIQDSINHKEWIDTNPSKGQFEAGTKRVFENKVFNAADQIIRRIITDRPFYEGAYNYRLKELQLINKSSEVTEQMKENAKLYALDKVFQNNSTIAKKVTAIRKQIPIIGDLIVPFAQTPSNLADKLVDYTPLVLGKIIHQFGKSKNSGFDNKLFVDRISRFLSGSALAVFGYYLAKNGMITGSLNKKSQKARENEIARGKQAYSIKLGDKYYNYDWMSPTGGILAGAADFFNSQKGDNYTDILESGIVGAGDTILNQSMLRGVLDMLSGYSPTAGFAKSILGSSTQAQPTTLKQFAKITDQYERETKDKNVGRNVLNRIISGVPKLRETLPPKINIYGQKINTKKSNNPISNIFDTFINPSNISKIDKSNVSKELNRLYNISKTSDMLIPIAPEEIEYKDFSYKPNSKELQDWKSFYGKKQVYIVNELLKDDLYKESSDTDKIKILKSVLRKNKKQISGEYIEKKGLLND